jgi:hypothetical protein
VKTACQPDKVKHMEHFYDKKHKLLLKMKGKVQELQTLLSLLSEHEETAPAGDCSEFYNLGIALDEVTGEVDALTDAVSALL